MPRPPQPPTVVSLFSGAGGLDLGLERAGFRTVAATDIDRDAVATLAAVRDDESLPYLRDTNVKEADVADLSRRDLVPTGVTASWRPTLLAGGPPCQPFSSAGHQKGLNDPRGKLFSHFVRLADELRPDFILFENVRGLVTARTPDGVVGGVLAAVKASFEELGYATRFALLNAADFGAPQRRVRLYMVASLRHQLPEWPASTHARLASDGRAPWVDLRTALAACGKPLEEDVVRPSGIRAGQILELVPGTGLRTGGAVENNRPGGHWGYRQDAFMADLELPGRTVRAASTPDWIRVGDDVRRLTWRECAELQGFPADWPFKGTRASVFRQIGNAVQSGVAEHLGEQILRASRKRGNPESAVLPANIERNIRYTVAEHEVNGSLRRRSVAG